MNWRLKILKGNWTPEVGLPPPQGSKHVCNHNIQKSFSLKPLDQSKSNFIGSICMKGTNVFINKPGHLTKMATMPIYHGKNPSKISRTAEHIAADM